MQIKSVHLTYQLKEVMRFAQPVKILYNHQQLQTILLKDGKWIIEYDYGILAELGRTEIKFKESKLGINVTYCDKYEIYFILYEGLQLLILKKKMVLLNTIKFDSKYTVGLHYFNGHLLLLGLEEIDLLKFEFIIKKKDPKIEDEGKFEKKQKNTDIKQDGSTKLPEIRKYSHENDGKKEQKRISNRPSLKISEEDKCKYLAKDNFDMAHISKKSVLTSKEWNLGFYISDDYLFIWGAKDLTVMKQEIIEKLQKDWDQDQNQYGFQSWFYRAKQQIDSNLEGNHNVIQTVNFKIVQKYHDLTKHENLITCLLHLIEFRYFVVGFETGQLKLWKINTSVKKSELLVHSYEGHSKQVESLIRSKNDKMFWSQGLDFQIRLWDIQQFTNVYTVNIVGIYTNLQLLTRSRFLLRNESELYIGYLNNNLKIYRTTNSKIVSYFKFNDSVLLALDNSPGLLVSENQEPLIMYPPPKSMEVRQLVTDGISYYMLLEGGMLFITTNTQTVQCLQSEEILDFDGYHMVQNIVSVYLPKQISLPCYDADFGQSRDLQCTDQLIFGMSKGSVIVVGKNDPKKIFARMSYHREKVIHIAEIGNMLFTYCAEGLLKLVQISSKQIKCIRSLNSNQQIAFFVTFKNKALFFTYKGPFQIFKFYDDQLILQSDEKGSDHERQVSSIDFIADKKQYLTSSSDGKIKLWSSKKILLIQLVMEWDLQGAWLLKQNVLIAHGGKLSLVSIEDCKFTTISYEKSQTKKEKQSEVKFESYYEQIKIQYQQIKQQADNNKIVQTNETPRKIQLKQKAKASVSYVGGKVIFEDDKPIIVYRGKEKDLDSSQESSQSNIQIQEQSSSFQIQVKEQQQSQSVKQQKQREFVHDWEGLREYEENRINRFQPVQALPKLLLNSVDRKQPSRQRIMSRRDLTLQRIILQSINQ